MLLYHDPSAVTPRRVRIFLAEKGVAYDTIEVSIAKGANLTDEYRKKNPISLLPVLELSDGRILRESMAICRFIEEEHPQPNLFGTDAWERAVIEQWNRHAELELMLPSQGIFRQTHPGLAAKIKQVPEWGQQLRDLFGARMAWFERELGLRPYVAGNRFTVADITAVCAIDFARMSKIELDPVTQPNLYAWHERVAVRPSMRA